MKSTITDENALFGAELKLPSVVRPKIRPNSTHKRSKRCVVRFLFEQAFKRRFISNNFGWEAIDEIHSCGERFIPKFQGNRSMCE
jgi:hypothetical protein